jgi:hypothetical protein
MAAKGWKRPFDDPIPLPRGRELVTLEDARTYITKLPRGRARGAGMAGGDAGLDPGRDIGRTDNAGADRDHAGAEPSRRARIRYGSKAPSLGKAQASEGPMKTVWVYINTSKEVGDVDHLKVFANEEAAERWFEENDPEGVAFEYEVLE